MFFFTVAWATALGAVALWTVVRWLRQPTPQNARYAAYATGLAVVVSALTGAWLSL